MAHGAPDYTKRIAVPDVGVDIQNLSVYPGKTISVINEGVMLLSGTTEQYQVPSGQTLYITNIVFCVISEAAVANDHAGYFVTDENDANQKYIILSKVHTEQMVNLSVVFPIPYELASQHKIWLGLDRDDMELRAITLGYLE